MSVLVDSINHAAQAFTGRLLRPTDPGYDDLRRVHNGLIDKRPALIARCAGVADIVEAVRLARTLNLEVAVRGGGHNVAGHAAVDQGLICSGPFAAAAATSVSRRRSSTTSTRSGR
jgi:hypothetical protein